MIGRVGRLGFVSVALIAGAIGAHSLNPRELYREMYPLEPVRQDAFHICDESDPTFIRAIGSEREACYNKMPHIMAVAMGRIRPGGALSMQALTDPSREAELLMTLAAMPQRQPITTPRSFANTAWVRALTMSCDERGPVPAVAYAAPGALPPPAGTGRAAAFDNVVRNNLPALPRGTQGLGQTAAVQGKAPVITLVPSRPAAAMPQAAANGKAAFEPLPAPDVGDQAAPAIVPLAPARTTCDGA